MNIRRALRQMVRRTKPIARRLRRVASPRKDRLILIDPKKPSFYFKIEEAKRKPAVRTPMSPNPVWTLINKQTSYAFARSHGIAVPQVFGVWDEPEAIRWETLPAEFVLKTDRGAVSRGVFPCQWDGELLHVAGIDTPLRPSEFVERIAAIKSTGKVGYPLFAEEWLRTSATAAPPELPVDVKLYTFFGTVGMVMLRSVPTHGKGAYSVRYLSREGEDLGDISSDRTVSAEIPVPKDLGALVEAAERLSAATRSAFIRVDLYETVGGVVFGELTPIPGNRQYFSGGVDEKLGALWEGAQRRLASEIRTTGVLDLEYGPHPRD